ncbi:MAG: tRNA pseudouridine(38-40) synthase TruA [Verrucomicrobium sp.]|nr:tRNA pseudouridine(38-40) synthase TruA [Verrucomicrobium sp.]
MRPEPPLAGHRLLIAYVGTGFHGWQRQAGHSSIQEEVEKVLAQIWKRPISLEGSGRTDTGVHALAQPASFTAPRKLAAPVLLRALNDHLPAGIRVRRVDFLEPTFHARFDVAWKTYEYRVWNAPFTDPFQQDRVWHVPVPLDLEAMRAAAAKLQGRHDFTSFASNPGYARPSMTRHLKELEVRRSGSLVTVRATADGFLYHMVRNLTGALVAVGKGRLSPAELGRILSARQRTAAPASAPAHGLYLKKVVYFPKAARLERAKNRKGRLPAAEVE